MIRFLVHQLRNEALDIELVLSNVQRQLEQFGAKSVQHFFEGHGEEQLGGGLDFRFGKGLYVLNLLPQVNENGEGYLFCELTKWNTYPEFDHDGIRYYPEVPQQLEYSPDAEDEIYRLKIECKRMMKSLGRGCVWLRDAQAEHMATRLYQEVHKTENLFRELIYVIMMGIKGQTWWSELVPKNIRDLSEKRRGNYKKAVADFSDVNDELLHTDIDHLIEIVQAKRRVLDRHSDIVRQLLGSFVTSDLALVIDAVSNRIRNNQVDSFTVVQDDLGSRYFAKFLDPSFHGLWEAFAKDRHHVAHNKLVDKAFYEKVIRTAERLQGTLERGILLATRYQPTEEERLDVESWLQDAREEHLFVTSDARRPAEEDIVERFARLLEDELAEPLRRIDSMRVGEPLWDLTPNSHGVLASLRETNHWLAIVYAFDVESFFGGISTLRIRVEVDGQTVFSDVSQLQHPDYEVEPETGQLVCTLAEHWTPLQSMEILNAVYAFVDRYVVPF